MLDTMNPEDPFKGSYTPSGKSPKSKKRTVSPGKKTSKSDNFSENNTEETPKSKRKSRKKKHRKEEIAEPTRESYANKGYTGEESGDSLRSNGTYTLNGAQRKDVQSSIANLAGPVLIKSPRKVKSCTTLPTKQEEMDNVSVSLINLLLL